MISSIASDHSSDFCATLAQVKFWSRSVFHFRVSFPAFFSDSLIFPYLWHAPIFHPAISQPAVKLKERVAIGLNLAGNLTKGIHGPFLGRHNCEHTVPSTIEILSPSHCITFTAMLLPSAL